MTSNLWNFQWNCIDSDAYEVARRTNQPIKRKTGVVSALSWADARREAISAAGLAEVPGRWTTSKNSYSGKMSHNFWPNDRKVQLTMTLASNYRGDRHMTNKMWKEPKVPA